MGSEHDRIGAGRAKGQPLQRTRREDSRGGDGAAPSGEVHRGTGSGAPMAAGTALGRVPSSCPDTIASIARWAWWGVELFLVLAFATMGAGLAVGVRIVCGWMR